MPRVGGTGGSNVGAEVPRGTGEGPVVLLVIVIVAASTVERPRWHNAIPGQLRRLIGDAVESLALDAPYIAPLRDHLSEHLPRLILVQVLVLWELRRIDLHRRLHPEGAQTSFLRNFPAGGVRENPTTLLTVAILLRLHDCEGVLAVARRFPKEFLIGDLAEQDHLPFQSGARSSGGPGRKPVRTPPRHCQPEFGGRG